MIGKQNESNREIKQNERSQMEILVEDNDFGRFFEMATTNKIYVNGWNLHEIKNKI